jgi:hypothetical protein
MWEKTFFLKRKKVSVSSLLNRVQKLWIDTSNFRCQEGVHAKKQTLQYLAFKFLIWAAQHARGTDEMEKEKKKKKL